MVVLDAAFHEPPGGLPLGQDGAADDGLHGCVTCVALGLAGVGGRSGLGGYSVVIILNRELRIEIGD